MLIDTLVLMVANLLANSVDSLQIMGLNALKGFANNKATKDKIDKLILSVTSK